MSFTSCVYPELTGFKLRGERVPPPAFPDTCPVCGSPRTYPASLDGQKKYREADYACGGSYREKPQIQGHTDYFWGACPRPEADAYLTKDGNVICHSCASGNSKDGDTYVWGNGPHSLDDNLSWYLVSHFNVTSDDEEPTICEDCNEEIGG